MTARYLGQDQSCAVAVVATAESHLGTEQLAGPVECHRGTRRVGWGPSDYDRREGILAVVGLFEVNSGHAAAYALHLPFVVGLHLQQGDHAVAQFVEFVLADAELFGFRVIELGAEALVGDLEDNEVGAALFPVEGRAGREIIEEGIELQFRVGGLDGALACRNAPAGSG